MPRRSYSIDKEGMERQKGKDNPVGLARYFKKPGDPCPVCINPNYTLHLKVSLLRGVYLRCLKGHEFAVKGDYR